MRESEAVAFVRFFAGKMWCSSAPANDPCPLEYSDDPEEFCLYHRALQIVARLEASPNVGSCADVPTFPPPRDWVEDVLAFHRRYDVFVGDRPRFPSEERLARRMLLVEEEVQELRKAVAERDLVEMADAIADSIYVLIGLAISAGIDLRPIWDEVQRTNMRKEARGPDQKVVKPAGWVPPAIARIIADKSGALPKRPED